jgi:CheY-like chemotaxis protein
MDIERYGGHKTIKQVTTGMNKKKIRALIVDDEPFNLVPLELLLNTKGITDIDRAFNGLEALNKVKSLIHSYQPDGSNQLLMFDLILLDNSMPHLTGIECARALREMQNRGEIPASTKIMMISGDYFNDDRREDLMNLFDEILSKPLKSDLFFSVLDKLGLL